MRWEATLPVAGALLGATVVTLWLARRTQASLEQRGLEIQEELAAGGSRTQLQLEAQARQWARESEAYFEGQIRMMAPHQVAVALTQDWGLSASDLQALERLARK